MQAESSDVLKIFADENMSYIIKPYEKLCCLILINKHNHSYSFELHSLNLRSNKKLDGLYKPYLIKQPRIELNYTDSSNNKICFFSNSLVGGFIGESTPLFTEVIQPPIKKFQLKFYSEVLETDDKNNMRWVPISVVLDTISY